MSAFIRPTQGMRRYEPNGTSLWMSLVVQFRVLGALVIREMNTRYGRENIGFLWIIGEPILFCAGVTIGWSLLRPAHEHGVGVTAIVVTGYVPLTMWRHCIGRGVKAFESNGSLLFHRQVTPLDIITSRVALEVIGTLMAGGIVMTGAIVTGYMDLPVDVSLMYAGLFYHIFFSYATALIISSLSEMSDIVERSVGIISYLSIPFSGTFFMVDWVPESFQRILAWSPSIQNLEMIRAGQFGPGVHPHYDFIYDTWMTALLVLIGLSLVLRVRKHILVI